MVQEGTRMWFGKATEEFDKPPNVVREATRSVRGATKEFGKPPNVVQEATRSVRRATEELGKPPKVVREATRSVWRATEEFGKPSNVAWEATQKVWEAPRPCSGRIEVCSMSDLNFTKAYRRLFDERSELHEGISKIVR